MNGTDTEGAALLHQPQEQAPKPHEGHYIKAAKAIYPGVDYDFDLNPTVSMTEDGGAWVAGWVWVPDTSAVEAMTITEGAARGSSAMTTSDEGKE